MTVTGTAEPLEDCLAQLGRTSAWLRSLPLARFGHEGGTVERQARALIGHVHQCVRTMCRSLAADADADADAGAEAAAAADCPPPEVEPEQVAVHALGDQLAVHAEDLARCGRACVSSGVGLPVTDLQELAAWALRLRSEGQTRAAGLA